MHNFENVQLKSPFNYYLNYEVKDLICFIQQWLMEINKIVHDQKLLPKFQCDVSFNKRKKKKKRNETCYQMSSVSDDTTPVPIKISMTGIVGRRV